MNLSTLQLFPAFDALSAASIGAQAKLDAYHLQVLAVSPDHQRKGVGKALIEHVKEKVRAGAGVGALMYLEAATDDNVSSAMQSLRGSLANVLAGRDL